MSYSCAKFTGNEGCENRDIISKKDNQKPSNERFGKTFG